jgi:hypothetical protein
MVTVTVMEKGKSQKKTKKILRELNLLKEEIEKKEKFLERDKDIFSKEISKLDKNLISNSIQKEEKISLWWRIKKVLGMS